MAIDWSKWILEKNLKHIIEELNKASSANISPKKAAATPIAIKPEDPRKHYHSLHPDTHAFLTNLSKQHPIASHELVTPEEGGFSDIEPGDLVIHSDFGDTQDPEHPAHHPPNTEYDNEARQNDNDFHTLMDHHGDQINEHMKNKGYYSHEENDGSGNGMYYGATLWRQDPNFRKPKPKVHDIKPEVSNDIQEPPEASV